MLRYLLRIRIDDLLSRMTTHEKVMQLNQYTLGNNNNENNVGEVAGGFLPNWGR